MRDDLNQSQDKKEKEIDDFLNQFNKPDEVEDSFNEITNRFEKKYGTGPLNKEEVNGTSSTASNEASDPPDDSKVTTNRMERLRSRQANGESKPSTGQKASYILLSFLSSITGFFGSLAMKLKLVDKSSSVKTEENSSGEIMARSDKKKKKKYKLNFKRLILFILILGMLCCAAVGGYVLSIVSKMPEIDTSDIYSLLSENSVLYDSNGNVLENITKPGSSEIRTNISFTDLPEDLVDAFVAIEDKTFWEHNGFNFVRILGAIWESVTTGDPISGTSTLTQQLARNLYLSGDREMTRKIQEAWYAVQLEKEMTKEQILEAYLNTINLGYGAHGVQAAAQAYFSKDVSELTLPECAALATIPKSPTKFALLKGDANENIEDPDALDIVSRTDTWTIWYNDTFKDRQELVLYFMHEQGKIDDAEYEAALAYDMRESMNPGTTNVSAQNISSYFADYTVSQVVADLMTEYNLSNSEAREMLYTKGLRIYSTLDVNIQKSTEDIYKKNSNFPEVRRASLNKDKNGNILNANGNVLLYKKATYFDSEGNFVLAPSEYQWNSDGSLTVFKGKRMNFYNTKVQGKTDVSVEFKNLYTEEDGLFYSIAGGVISIGADYKIKDDNGNLVISAQFFTDHPNVIVKNGDNLTISSNYYSLKQQVMQPQSAVVIMDYHTGEIKAMVGGRSTSGKLLYNRATGTRQPGSSFKPIGVYGPAIESKTWTAASVIDDSPMVFEERQWPKNWYEGFRGLHTLRQSVEQSVNVNAVKVFVDIGVQKSLEFAKNLGISTIVESGEVNDLNASSLALGGMTNGVSPLEMAAAYGAFANEGVYTEPICYTKVTDKNGTILLERTPETHQAMSEGTASIMTDILRSTVTNGLAKRAQISNQPVAGKTGTTTDNYDAWFVGFTPYYSAAVWIGNDVNLELDEGSASATRVWQLVMSEAHKGLARKEFVMDESVVTAEIDTKSGKLPSELSALDPRGSTVRTEYFLEGTVPIEIDDVHVQVDVCNASGDLATPWCSDHSVKVLIDRPEDPRFTVTEENKAFLEPNNVIADEQYDAPSYYCHLHNGDTINYPIDPALFEDPNFVFNPSTSPAPGTDTGEGYIDVPEHMEGVVGGEESGEEYTGDGAGQIIDSGSEETTDPSSEMPEWLQ
ncbi:MAG: PBP1A family penicillin-binding protein [Firmicutes bacterium]|nr:PBP1A family penicillin-binding protein [Bacillota bacterium]